jgi:hypothetical protein
MDFHRRRVKRPIYNAIDIDVEDATPRCLLQDSNSTPFFFLDGRQGYPQQQQRRMFT